MLTPGARGELLQILALRAAVVLAERVDMIDVAQHRTRALGEPVRPRSPEIPRRHDAAVNVRLAGRDEPPRFETAENLLVLRALAEVLIRAIGLLVWSERGSSLEPSESIGKDSLRG